MKDHSAPPASADVDPHVLYWRKNLRLMIGLLIIWAIAGLGCGVLWADFLNEWSLFDTGYPLGFWFAQQGSILIFVLLILIYAVAMNRLDRRLKQSVAERKRRKAEADA
ncbi:MAG: DUF4212 domain-containing protein [Opitutales bacterium]|nr:DUF4212 domain-containing protein [Opitutales bacterium]